MKIILYKNNFERNDMIKHLTTISYLYLRKAFANSLTKSRNILEVKKKRRRGLGDRDGN
jgi:hypothetical protein